MSTPSLSPRPSLDAVSGASRHLVEHLQKSAVFREYQQAFEMTLGLPLILRPVGAFQPPLLNSKRQNPFCALMAANNRSCAACLQQQQRIEDGASERPQTLTCYTGLSESAVPVRVGQRVIGYLQTGQVFLRAPSAAQFRKTLRQLAAWKVAIDEAEIETAYFRSRVIKKSQYESVLRLLNIFAQHLAALSNQIMLGEATADSPVMARARRYIAEHQAGELSLSQVARAVNMSAFYFCKMFKKATGLTFTDYVARARIEHTKQLLLNPHTRVSEAAFEAGFQSLSQFNRVFRRIVGEAPSAYRDRLHGRSNPGSPPAPSLERAA